MESPSTSPADKTELGLTAKLLRNLRPSHQHSAFSATLLLMASVMLARVIGYLREMYVAWAFGAGPKTDAYVAAFTIPDFMFYILAGGTASITFISIYARHTAKGEERQAQQAFNSTITIMTVVTLAGTILVEIFTPQLERLIFPKFTAEQLELCVYLTRILLPGPDFFLCRGNRLCGAVLAPNVPLPGAEPGVLRLVHHSGRTDSARTPTASRRWLMERWWAHSSGRF